MFVLDVEFLTGRVYSSVFDDGDNKQRPEWPPHPSRLYSALVSAWGEGGAEENLVPALEWLEKQGPPAIYSQDIRTRNTVAVYVPVNNEATLPEDRPRKERAFPSATLISPHVYFEWPHNPPAEIAIALNTVLDRTCALGHSASLVSVNAKESVPEGDWKKLIPGCATGRSFRIPYPGRLKELRESYAQFLQGGNKVHRPTRGKTTRYDVLSPASTKISSGLFDTMIVLRKDEGERVGLESSLALTAAVRGAMLSHGPQPLPEFMSGHAPNSTPENPIRSEHPHVGLVPLAFVASPHAQGTVSGLAALLPRAFSPDQQAICWETFEKIRQLEMGWGRWTVSLADVEDVATIQPETWKRACKTWSTVTPFVFDRFPDDPYGEDAENVVRQAFVRVGYPEPAHIALHYNPWLIGVPKASHFRPAPARKGKPQRYHCHVRVTFSEMVAGPMVAGAGRFYGYGLFRSHSNTGAAT